MKPIKASKKLQKERNINAPEGSINTLKFSSKTFLNGYLTEAGFNSNGIDRRTLVDLLGLLFKVVTFASPQ